MKSRTVFQERADEHERTMSRERAASRKSTEALERSQQTREHRRSASEPPRVRAPILVSESSTGRSTIENERADDRKSTVQHERAELDVSTETRERAARQEGTDWPERAAHQESTSDGERAVPLESTVSLERAVPVESTDESARAENLEGAIHRERAVIRESTVTVERVDFVVSGIAAPQGSKVRTKWGVREDNPNTAPWRNAVAAAAREAMTGRALLAGPLELSARFYFPRPKAHYRTGRFAGELKASAPAYVETAPDLDKLVRAIGDACKGIVYRDDSLIARLAEVEKLYGPPRAEITLRTIAC